MAVRGNPKELNEAKNRWDAALIYQKIAEASGELGDLYQAIACFEKNSCEEMPQEFWLDFGKTYAMLSEHVQDARPIIQSIACYKQALSSFEGWMGLARSLKKQYLLSREDDHYLQACHCFETAAQLKPQASEAGASEAWLEHIELIIDSSKQKKESAKLRVAIKKCEQAKDLFEPSSHVQAYWAEALAFLGAWTHQIELIQEATRKMDELFSEDEEDLFLINQSGKCLFAFAQYYSDLDLYYQAIEEFQTSISIDRTQLTCWVWMGATFAKVYEQTNDLEALENSVYFYKKSLQIKNDPHLYHELATLLIQLGEASGAISYLEYLLQAYKSVAHDHPEWFFQYGLALDVQGEITDNPSLYYKALHAFACVLILNPNYPAIHHRLAVLYCHLGDSLDSADYLHRSLHHFQLASALQPEDETFFIDWGLAWIHLAEQATNEDNSFREAEQRLMQAAQLGSQLVYYPLACLYSELGLFDLSVSYLRKSHTTQNLPPLEELMDDDWLERVRLSPHFQEFLALLQKT